MKLALLLTLLFSYAQAQKPPITDTTYRTWPTVSDGALSNDGNYACYSINSTCIIKSTTDNWEFSSASYSNINFSNDSKSLFAMSNDTLVQLKLHTTEVVKIPDCKNYYLLDKWLIYELANHMLVVRNGKTFTFPDVDQVILNKAASVILFKTQRNGQEDLHWLDLRTGRASVVYHGSESGEHIFDPSGEQMAFTTVEKGGKYIWYYKSNSTEAEVLANDDAINTTNVWQFSNDKKKLFFTLSKLNPVIEKESNLTIWSYQDTRLMSNIKNKSWSSILYKQENLTVLDIREKKIKQLLSGNQITYPQAFYSRNNDVLIVESSNGGAYETQWNKAARKSYYICLVTTGQLIPVKENCITPLSISISSNSSKYLVYFDPETLCYKSYNVQTSGVQNLTKPVPRELYDNNISGYGKIEGWINGTETFIVRTNLDLWLLDAENIRKPVNLTKGTGIAFSVGEFADNGSFDVKKDILITGFNLKNKEQSVYKLNIQKGTFIPIIKTSDWIVPAYSVIPPAYFIKAKYAEKYLIKSEATNSSPNYFYIDSLQHLTAVSDVHPEKNYNWISSKLIRYNDKTGKACESILYLPENFDASKKYPVIFNYYLIKSDRLNKYINPDPSVIGVNIPLLVSNGYIVCVPDIYSDRGTVGESGLLSVNAAADYLSRYTWIDTTKFALTGHSLAGYITYYIVTHSNRFKAAVSAAGVSDLIGSYNQTMLSGEDAHSYIEGGGYFMKKGLQEIPAIYAENTPILFAKNIQTPLLLLHNTNDGNVAVDHSVQMFIQLRSLQKPVWLLQYKDERHVLVNEENQLDCQQKAVGFFDYYLKGKPMPDWMKEHL